MTEFSLLGELSL